MVKAKKTKSEEAVELLNDKSAKETEVKRTVNASEFIVKKDVLCKALSVLDILFKGDFKENKKLIVEDKKLVFRLESPMRKLTMKIDVDSSSNFSFSTNIKTFSELAKKFAGKEVAFGIKGSTLLIKDKNVTTKLVLNSTSEEDVEPEKLENNKYEVFFELTEKNFNQLKDISLGSELLREKACFSDLRISKNGNIDFYFTNSTVLLLNRALDDNSEKIILSVDNKELNNYVKVLGVFNTGSKSFIYKFSTDNRKLVYVKDSELEAYFTITEFAQKTIDLSRLTGTLMEGLEANSTKFIIIPQKIKEFLNQVSPLMKGEVKEVSLGLKKDNLICLVEQQEGSSAKAKFNIEGCSLTDDSIVDISLSSSGFSELLEFFKGKAVVAYISNSSAKRINLVYTDTENKREYIGILAGLMQNSDDVEQKEE